MKNKIVCAIRISLNSLRVNIDKCKYIIINDKNGTSGERISINDITLERVEKLNIWVCYWMIRLSSKCMQNIL